MVGDGNRPCVSRSHLGRTILTIVPIGAGRVLAGALLSTGITHFSLFRLPIQLLDSPR